MDPRLSYAEAKRRLTDAAERRYLDALLRHHRGNVFAAARAAGMNRGYLHRLLRRHGIRGE
jgi:transcriptional regulator of acetoin/glycerol metabolism